MTDFEAIRAEFPILDQEINGHPLVYLDSGATAQKPQCVIDAESEFYSTINAGVHRGAHELAARSTMAFEDARAKVARLVGANWEEGEEELVVTSGATGGLNLLATAFGNASMGRGGEAARKRFGVGPGDEIVVSKAEHHSVLLPFQELAARTGATLKWFELDGEGRILADTAGDVITDRTKIVAVTHVGNVTGAVTDIAPIIRRAHEVGALFVLDACQSVPHLAVDFHALDVDFAAFSAHKMYGPTGVGFLYGRRDLLELLPPASFGGSMVELAWMDRPADYMMPPARFEAGTQPVAQVVAAGVAADWLMGIGMENVEAHEHELAGELLGIQDIDGVRLLGPKSNERRIGTIAFEIDGVHPHDVGQYIDAQGIAIRVGHHCAQPVHRHFGVYASNRASAGVYNDKADIERFLEAVGGVRKFFGA
ncbi:SufS family cysteine desulfurase [Bifidobacterium choloepi]|uniref:Cysteine desulfurase n=1 Tax=Bifidobacterium choloepi TaxID=2614131 RepID=A0A6I5MY94_9BIFI|nr:SufS family cysteine desulfurase [Bifidobacterium choloepi]NEG69247.1 SufS family cysteine desulfurase [Bifidobacterium choloepi]